jgi:hypothetical protein
VLLEVRTVKPTNEALRAWAANFSVAMNCKSGRTIPLQVPDFGVVHVTERAVFVEAVIEIPLDENGGIAE